MLDSRIAIISFTLSPEKNLNEHIIGYSFTFYALFLNRQEKLCYVFNFSNCIFLDLSFYYF